MKLKIGQHTVKVKYVDTLDDELGLCYCDSDLILISKKGKYGRKISKKRLNQVLWHELLHYIEAITGHLVFGENEGAIDAFAEYISDIIERNDL